MSKDGEPRSLELVKTDKEFSNLINFGMVLIPSLKSLISWSVGVEKESNKMVLFKNREVSEFSSFPQNIAFVDGFRVDMNSQNFIILFYTVQREKGLKFQVYQIGDTFQEVEFDAIFLNDINTKMKEFEENLDSIYANYDKFGTDIEFIFINQNFSSMVYWRVDLILTERNGKLNISFELLNIKNFEIDDPPQSQHSSEVRQIEKFESFSCQPTQSFLLCGGMSNWNEPFLVYFKKEGHRKSQFLSYSLHSEKSPQPIDPRTAFIIQNYQGDIMGYVNPENLSIREVKIRTMAQFWLFICLGSFAL